MASAAAGARDAGPELDSDGALERLLSDLATRNDDQRRRAAQALREYVETKKLEVGAAPRRSQPCPARGSSARPEPPEPSGS